VPHRWREPDSNSQSLSPTIQRHVYLGRRSSA
jgi:hypothetical protein